MPAKMAPPAMPAVTDEATPARSRARANTRAAAPPTRGGQEILGLLQLGHGGPGRIEGRGGQQDHGRVDGPAHQHGEQGVQELVAQLVADDLVVVQVPLPALDDLRVQEQVVGHDHGPEHAHDHGHGPVREAGGHPAQGGLAPVHVDHGQLHHEGYADERDQADDHPLHPAVGVGEEHPADHGQHQEGPQGQGYPEEHLEGDGPAQKLGHGRGDRGQNGCAQGAPGGPGRQVAAGRLREAQARGDAQVGGVVLQDDEHHRGQADHPQELVAEIRPGGHVGGPVAGVDEAHRDQQSRSDVFPDLQGHEPGAVAHGQIGEKARKHRGLVLGPGKPARSLPGKRLYPDGGRRGLVPVAAANGEPGARAHFLMPSMSPGPPWPRCRRNGRSSRPAGRPCPWRSFSPWP